MVWVIALWQTCGEMLYWSKSTDNDFIVSLDVNKNPVGS